MTDDLASFGGFAKSVIRSCAEGLRRNKLPASLAVLALAVTTALALTSDFDERPRYRKFLLPEIDKAESAFFDSMREAEEASNELWRVRFFLNGHRQAKSVLRVVRSQHPMTASGRMAQHELIRYYELADEELAIIRTEMSFNESYDYIAAWKQRNAELMPIREQWVAWLREPS